MTDFPVFPFPDIEVSYEDASALPLLTFDLVVIVETNPAVWFVFMSAANTLAGIMYCQYDHFFEETFFGNPKPANGAKLKDIFELPFVWIRNKDRFVNFYSSLADVAPVRAIFNVDRLLRSAEHLQYYLKGIAAEHPDWRVAVIGATIEDEVIQAAKLIQEAGLETTVVARYCLSLQWFRKLVHDQAYERWLRTAGLDKNEIDADWLNEWMSDHDRNLVSDDLESGDKPFNEDQD